MRCTDNQPRSNTPTISSARAPDYVPLWCKSNFSFLQAASDPAELVEEARHLGLRSLALSDRDGVYGIMQAHVRAKELGLHLIVGSEISLDDDSRIVLLVQNRAGYANLCRLISRGRLRSPKGESKVSWDEFCRHAEGLLALWGGDRCLLAEAAATGVTTDELTSRLKDVFGDRLYAFVTRHRRADEPLTERCLRQRATRFGIPLVAAVEVLYHTPARRDVLDILTCIRHNVKLSEAGRRLRTNAEHALLAPLAFATLFADDPSAVARTCEVAERCDFSMDELRYRYPSERLPDGKTSSQWLRELTLKGARKRYGHRRDRSNEETEQDRECSAHDSHRGDSSHDDQLQKTEISSDVLVQLKKELNLIDELDYCGYFLTMYEIVRFCEQCGILC